MLEAHNENMVSLFAKELFTFFVSSFDDCCFVYFLFFAFIFFLKDIFIGILIDL